MIKPWRSNGAFVCTAKNTVPWTSKRCANGKRKAGSFLETKLGGQIAIFGQRLRTFLVYSISGARRGERTRAGRRRLQARRTFPEILLKRFGFIGKGSRNFSVLYSSSEHLRFARR